MVTLDDWDETQIKIKIFLKGNSGTGKSRTCVKMAGIMAKGGREVLFLDGEGGAERELKVLKYELTPEERRRIEYEHFSNYKEMFEKIAKEIDKKRDRLKVIIVDPMKLVEISRLSARDIYLAQGSAPSGYGMKEIKNKDSFDLSGTQYQLASTMTLNFLNLIVNCKQDVICTLTIKETKDREYKYRNEYDATFDYVYETLAETQGGSLVFKAFPKKRRGAKTTDSVLIDDLLKEIVGIFREKYTPQTSPQISQQVSIQQQITVPTVETGKVEENEIKTEENGDNKNVHESNS